MTIRLQDKYPGQVNTSDPNMPYGKFKNVVTDGDNSGTPFEEEWPSDVYGAILALLDSAGITPNNTPDVVGASQFLDAINYRLGTPDRFSSLAYNLIGGAPTPHVEDLALTNLRGATYGDSGNKLYTLANDVLTEYALSEPYNVETATATGETVTNVAGTDTATNLTWKPDGTRVFFVDDGSPGNVHYIDLSTAWDLSTAGAAVSYTPSIWASGTAIAFSPDGTKMFLMGVASGFTIREHTLSTAWLPSSMTINGNLPSVENGRGIAFNGDGSRLFALGNDGVVRVYKLLTAYSALNSIKVPRTRDLSSLYPDPGGLSFSEDGAYALFCEYGGGNVWSMFSSTVRVVP